MFFPNHFRLLTSNGLAPAGWCIGFLFIRLHGLLDYITKLAYEIEHLKLSFDDYPRLASSKIKFGDYKRLEFSCTAGTLFERSDLVAQIETIRDHIIHNGLLDDMPKVYKCIEGGRVTEKFVLFPDMENGHLAKSGNRRLFYGAERKINRELPSLVAAFQQREMATLRLIENKLQQMLGERRLG